MGQAPASQTPQEASATRSPIETAKGSLATDASSKRDVIEPFEAFTLSGERLQVDTGAAGTWRVFCFVGNECPLVQLYVPRLKILAERYAANGVTFIAVNSNRQDTRVEVKSWMSENEITFPVITDPLHSIADNFDATRTPELIVVDHQLRIRYRGRVDDQYLPGVAKKEPARRDLQIALDELLAGNTVTVPNTPLAGCLIGRVRQVDGLAAASTPEGGEPTAESPVTFYQHVAPVIYRHCGECHRPGDIGPFALLDYEDVQGWGEMIVEVIDEGLMPPWHADPRHGVFSNTRHMPDADKELIRRWVAQGTPAGSPQDWPRPSAATSEWRLPRDPDLVVPMSTQPFAVPAEGTVDYQYFVVDPGLTEDRWVVGAEVIPGNRSVVHHTIVFVRAPDGDDRAGQGWLAAYVPGQRPTPYPPGYGRRIPAGSKFVFQQHYTTNGSPQEDITRIGLVFADESTITHQVDTLMALNQQFEIPPFAADYPAQGSLRRIPPHAELLSFSPHMHYRGKSFELIARFRPSTESMSTASAAEESAAGVGQRDSQVLLKVPRYDFNWQHVYELAEPLPLREVAQMDFEARFDNSAGNPANPDPTKTVTWGDQSWEEMAVIFFDVAWPRGETARSRSGVSETPAVDPDPEVIDQQIAEFFHRFGAANAESLKVEELPESIRRFLSLDRNGDGRVTRSEVRGHFEERWRRQNRRRDPASLDP